MRTLTVVLGLLVLTGCSTDPVTKLTAGAVPDSRQYDQALLKRKSSDQAEVSFLRDSGFLGSACTHDIYVDGTKAFSVRQGEGMSVFVDPGEHVFRLETGGGACPNVATSQETNLKPGADVIYRILIPSDLSLRLTRIK
ncbi:hypothetical protein ABIC11_001045 [Pseudomonas oryzihabitans]